MSRLNFNNWVNDYTTFDNEVTNSLEELQQSYPYCQSIKILLSQAYQSTGKVEFEEQLKLTAAFASDRKHLHNILFTSNKVTDSTPQEVIEKSSSESNEVKELNPLQNQILSSAISSSVMLEVSDDLPDLDDLTSVQAKSSALDNHPIEEVQHTTFDSEESHSFSEWLHHFADPSEEEQSSEEMEIYLSNPQKSEFYSAAKMARLSVKEDNDLVTETLANIYASQGNLEKAIESFERLQLKYPEKSTYFAGRIKELQQNNNV